MNRIPRWAVASAVGAPVLLIGGWTLAEDRQPAGYSPVRDTISALAARGATDRWVMTSALAGLGACYVITAFGLRPARRAGRGVLAGGGVATLLVAVFPQPAHGNSVPHTVAATAAFISLGVWPMFAVRSAALRTTADPPHVGDGNGGSARAGGVVRGGDPRRSTWTRRARRGRRTDPVAAGCRPHDRAVVGRVNGVAGGERLAASRRGEQRGHRLGQNRVSEDETRSLERGRKRPLAAEHQFAGSLLTEDD